MLTMIITTFYMSFGKSEPILTMTTCQKRCTPIAAMNKASLSYSVTYGTLGNCSLFLHWEFCGNGCGVCVRIIDD
ncbi:hypothetical protein BLNAU_20631 [Blattamonas nauphoetae]|uniref:Secreted protein n=1 Tax=Blattamonas nauphoetae TaxID=2049346 RepID=A0ABQ9X0E0_9EUKA|nr:hypothetical protein BLNAU_20631 [Blattamonas nauphoetae]